MRDIEKQAIGIDSPGVPVARSNNKGKAQRPASLLSADSKATTLTPSIFSKFGKSSNGKKETVGNEVEEGKKKKKTYNPFRRAREGFSNGLSGLNIYL